MSKDYFSKICNYCGREFKRPFPSLQENPPKGVTKEEFENIVTMVWEDLKYHQNHTCSKSPSKGYKHE